MNWAEFITIAVWHLFAVASPGPDFLIVTRQSVTGGIRLGMWTSAGVGLGILVHVSYCIFGVAILLSQSPTLLNLMKYLAAGYLAFLGWQSLRASFQTTAAEPLAGQSGLSIRGAFWSGFLTNGLNPKVTLFFLALFTGVIDFDTPIAMQMFYGLYLAVATFIWFAGLTVILGKPAVREFMLRAGPWFERGMGILLFLLALQIVLFA